MSYHRALIAKLQRHGRWLVQGSAGTITLTRKFGKKAHKIVTVVLEKEPDGLYVLAPINYAFRSSVSHFDYCMEETRWARNKTFIKSLIGSLKECEVWDLIKNKETFIKVNGNNAKVNKALVKDQLNKII